MYQKFKMSPIWRTDFASQVNQWRVDWRYNPRDWKTERAEAFLRSVERVYNWLEANRS